MRALLLGSCSATDFFSSPEFHEAFMSSLLSRTTLAILAVMLSAAPAAAQTREGTVFVTGGAFAGIERAAHTTSSGISDPALNPSGTAPGALIGVGTFVTPAWSVQFELALEGTIDKTTSFTYPDLPVTTRTNSEMRSTGGAALVGFHTRAHGRLALGYLGGLAFVRERQTSQRVVTGIPADPLESPEIDTVLYGSTAAVGMDADITVSRHLAIVPQVRAQTSARGLSIRPGVSARWSF
jgi:hypothetical protein